MDKTKLPVHVSLIMDGNGRWAQQQGKNRVYGHFEGVESVRAVMSASVDMGIKYVSFFAFSRELESSGLGGEYPYGIDGRGDECGNADISKIQCEVSGVGQS